MVPLETDRDRARPEVVVLAHIDDLARHLSNGGFRNVTATRRPVTEPPEYVLRDPVQPPVERLTATQLLVVAQPNTPNGEMRPLPTIGGPHDVNLEVLHSETLLLADAEAESTLRGLKIGFEPGKTRVDSKGR